MTILQSLALLMSIGSSLLCCFMLRLLRGAEDAPKKRSREQQRREDESFLRRLLEPRPARSKPHVKAEEDPYPRRREFVEDYSVRTDERTHLTDRGEWVRSRGEQIIADTFHQMGLSYEYERPWSGSRWEDTRMPDFTIYHGGRVYHWEHQGMRTPEYREKHRDQREWYESNGYTLIESEDPPERGIYVTEEEVREIVRNQILRP